MTGIIWLSFWAGVPVLIIGYKYVKGYKNMFPVSYDQLNEEIKAMIEFDNWLTNN